MDSLKNILTELEPPDYLFLSNLISTPFSLNKDKERNLLIDSYLQNGDDDTKIQVISILEQDLCYLGSSDIAYQYRKLLKKKPGINFDKIVDDVSKKLKVRLPIAPLDERLEKIVTETVSKELSKLKQDKLEEILKKAGANEEEIKKMFKKYGKPLGVAALSTIVQLFGRKVAEEIIKILVINLIAKYIGKEAAKKIVTEAAKRYPLWAKWIGPIGWAISGIWLGFDLQGPAYRKTVPSVLYLGICVKRIKEKTAHN